MAEIKSVPRIFVYDGKEYPDPDPSLTPKEIKEILSNQVPDILNASISGPELKDEKMIYEFGRNLGTKG